MVKESIKKLVEEIYHESQSGEEINHQLIFEKVREELKNVESELDRTTLLKILKIVWDGIEECNSSSEYLENFRRARRGYQYVLLIGESLVDGFIDPEQFLKATKREVQAGRMTADDEMYILALKSYPSTYDEPFVQKDRPIKRAKWFHKFLR